ncbi:MAG: Mur ligase family protein [Bdellovibrionota bacterium]
MINKYIEVIDYLESLQIMPKTMPGLEKIRTALELTDWYKKIDPSKVIIVAGTNGKGTTCAALESLLIEAKQRVAFYSSPHLVSTTERIRISGRQISQADFIEVFNQCFPLIKKCELSHFEALSLMAGHYFFSAKWAQNLDFVIFEVGLGGIYDATNAFPHKYSVITKLGLDHVNILGNSITEIAKNKFGIVASKNIVVHHPLPIEVNELKKTVQKSTNSNWVEAESCDFIIDKKNSIPRYFLKYNNTKFEINIIGKRAAENIMTALTLFQILGFDSGSFYGALNKIDWQGRMQKTVWPNLKCPFYLSGDHNLQGIDSLIEILADFKWKTLHLVVGIGVDKDATQMLKKLSELQNVKLYLTETPFKGLKINEYPEAYSELATNKDVNVINLLNQISDLASPEDLVLLTGSLYLVGEVLKKI